MIRTANTKIRGRDEKTRVDAGRARVQRNAHAENSVTLYGLADPRITWSSHANAQGASFLDSGAMSGNRWGLTGKESLGGGVSTVFTLEGGFNVANGALGQNGTFFGRQVFVGVDSPYGMVTLAYTIGWVTFGSQWSR